MSVYTWVQEYFERQLKPLLKEIAVTIGAAEKRAYDHMQTYVDQQTAMQRRLIEIQGRKLEELIEKQAKSFESLEHRTRSIEAVFGRSGTEASIVDDLRRRA